MTRRMNLVIVALLLSLSLGSVGCNRYGWQLLGDAVELAAYVAVTAIVLSAHDRHYHDAYCGHTHVYYEGHDVYDYRGRWEYYDRYDDRWYYYPDGIPGY